MRSRVKGAVLCGGRGEALKPLSNYFQKSMIPVGSLEKPVLEYIVRHLAYHGLREITLLVGYKANQIMNYFGDGGRFGVNITYMLDSEKMKGTGGALINAYNAGAFEGSDVVLVYYGDILTNIDIADMLTHHKNSKAEVTIALAGGYRVPVGVAEITPDKQIVRLVEKPKMENLAVVGILAINTDVLHRYRNLRGEKDIIEDIVSPLVKEGGYVNAYVFEGEWFDIGSAEKYEKVKPEDIDRLYSHLNLAREIRKLNIIEPD